MTTIFYAEPELVVALNSKIVFVNPNDLQIFKEVFIPEDLTEHGLKPFTLEENHDEVEKTDEKNSKNQPTESESKEKVNIQHVSLSPNGQLLAVTTSGQKALLLYQCRLEHAKLVSVRSLARISSALTFASDSSKLLVTDKTGDCYEYDCINMSSVPRLLLGHLSIVYDVLWTADQKFIITCDRDEKIRITNYPKTYEIHGYCLGHTEFVSGLALLSHDALVSVSGDKSLRLWDYKNCKEQAKIDLPAPGLKISHRKLSENSHQVAVLLYQPNESVAIYNINRTETSGWNISEHVVLNFPEMCISNLCFAKDRLYLAAIVDNHLQLSVANLPESSPVPDNWLDMLQEQFQDDIWTPEDVSARFKKHFDNVSDYLERKRKRIEETQK
ncbi:tRNA (guanine-N(7)-)-methyltransferase non-catalytic subunit wuho [Teleopsis dalmanni]|uniref:tRNA (guanine-N(7)-)-methyltransferase non-catalytic subunit wuho n=1 Tax=Teleopsis dalmanni TaxID=139649 RepID=UPI0018CDB312|nr:tRNA (guanine-N(7)-)-methyltransferase non-catalytic subunit wuho [Teleopsis dalmanni]